MAIPTQDSWTSAHLEHPRESCEPVKAGQRRKCHIIDLAECSSIPEAGQRRKCNRIDLSECPSIAQAGQRRKCNRIDLSECRIVIPLGSTSSSRNRWPGLRPRLEETVFQGEDSDRMPNPGGVPGRVLKDKRPTAAQIRVLSREAAAVLGTGRKPWEPRRFQVNMRFPQNSEPDRLRPIHKSIPRRAFCVVGSVGTPHASTRPTSEP